MDRPEITADKGNSTVNGLQIRITKALIKTGNGAFISRHEILGALQEEFREVEDAVRSADDLDKLAEELFDVAVVSVIAGISLRLGRLD